MASETMVFGAALRRSEKWRVFQIRTANSTYELELQSAQDAQARRCAVLTRVAPEAGAGESFTDASPLADGKSLFDVSPVEWMGKRLTIGTAQTSEVQSVDFIGAADRPAARDRVLGRATQTPRNQVLLFGAPAANSQPPPKAEQKSRDWAPFPLSHVEMAEMAATFLKAIVHRADLFPALKGDDLAERRMTLSLAECRLMLEALHRRG